MPESVASKIDRLANASAVECFRHSERGRVWYPTDETSEAAAKAADELNALQAELMAERAAR